MLNFKNGGEQLDGRRLLFWLRILSGNNNVTFLGRGSSLPKFEGLGKNYAEKGLDAQPSIWLKEKLPCEANAFSKADNFAICNNWKFLYNVLLFDESVTDIFCEYCLFLQEMISYIAAKEKSFTRMFSWCMKNKFFQDAHYDDDEFFWNLLLSEVLQSQFNIFGNLTHSLFVMHFLKRNCSRFLTLRYHNYFLLKRCCKIRLLPSFFFVSIETNYK